MSKDCPATEADDDANCMIVEQAGRAYNNWMQYLTSWQQHSISSSQADPANRPPPVAIFNGNGSWVDQVNVSATSQTYNRTITNVSMVVPHAGIVKAAAVEDNRLPKAESIDVCMSH